MTEIMKKSRPVAPPKARLPYRAPVLRQFGSLRDLTAGGSGMMAESPDMNMNRFP